MDTLRSKFAFFTISIIVLVVLCRIVPTIWALNRERSTMNEWFREYETERMREALQERVEFIEKVLALEYQSLQNSGATDAACRERMEILAKRLVDSLRYDKGVGYLWITKETDLHPLMVAHGSLPHLNGTLLGGQPYKGPAKQKYLFAKMHDIVRDSGMGYITYNWPHPVLGGPGQKTAFVKGFSPLDWVIGTGSYSSDIENTIAGLTAPAAARTREHIVNSIVISAAVLLFGIVATLAFTRRFTESLQTLSSTTARIPGNGERFDLRVAETGCREVRQLAQNFNAMLQRLENAFHQLRNSGEKLAVEEAKYREIFDSLLDVYFRTDELGRVTLISPSVQSLLGYSPEEILGMPAEQFIAPQEEREVIHSTLRSTGKLSDTRVMLEKRDGTRLWCSVNARPKNEGSRPRLGLEGIIRDIDGRKRAEDEAAEKRAQLLQADKLKSLGTLVSGVAHEINNPNNYIRMGADNLEVMWTDISSYLGRHASGKQFGGIPCDQAREWGGRLITAVREGSVRISRIVSGLKDFARADSGKVNAAFDLNSAVRSAEQLMATTIRHSTDRYVSDTDTQLPYVMGNHQQVEQVVVNLLTNACQALEKPAQSIHLRTYRGTLSPSVILEVTDEGKGMDQETLRRAFDPFFTTKQPSEGTGIGLSVTHGIIREHGGHIEIESKPDLGTNVRITLPSLSAATVSIRNGEETCLKRS